MFQIHDSRCSGDGLRLLFLALSVPCGSHVKIYFLCCALTFCYWLLQGLVYSCRRLCPAPNCTKTLSLALGEWTAEAFLCVLCHVLWYSVPWVLSSCMCAVAFLSNVLIYSAAFFAWMLQLFVGYVLPCVASVCKIR